MYFWEVHYPKKTIRYFREKKVHTKDVHNSIGYNCEDIEMAGLSTTSHSHAGGNLFILLDRYSEADFLHKFWETMLLPNFVQP